jgi:hypothetical protein
MGYVLYNYEYCADVFSSCRTPSLGKPISGKNIRVFKKDNDFHLVANGKHFATIAPDDTITFVMDSETLYSTIATSMVYKMSGFLGLSLFRVGPGRYRIGRAKHYSKNKLLPEYYGGIKFSMVDGICLNPRPDKHTLIVKEARKLWLTVLRKYKLGALSRFKLGVRGVVNYRSYFNSDELAQWMVNGEYPDTLIDILTTRAGGPSASYEEMARQFDAMIDFHRDALRKRFGVFDNVQS